MPSLHFSCGGEPVLLHLEVHVLRAEHPAQLVRMRACVRDAVLQQALAEARGQAARERDDPVRVALDLSQVDGRLAPLQTLEKARR